MRTLLLEDDEETATALRTGLSQSGYDVTWVASAPDALGILTERSFELVILDVMVPGGTGYDVVRWLRREREHVPVLILTARDTVADRVEGLDVGADDYLVKPFAFAELLARVRALLRRPARRVEPVRAGVLVLDPVHRVASVGERRLDLTRVEFDLLLALAEQGGSSLTRRDLLAMVWGYRFDPGTNVVDVHVARLRRKLETVGAPDAIQTVRGVGYAISS